MSREAICFPSAYMQLEENCELRGTVNRVLNCFRHLVMGDEFIRPYFRAKWRLLCLLFFKYFSQHTPFVKLGISLRYSIPRALCTLISSHVQVVNFFFFRWCFQVPSCRLWARVSLALFEFFLTPKSDLIAPLTTMASHLDLDMKFSEA